MKYQEIVAYFKRKGIDTKVAAKRTYRVRPGVGNKIRITEKPTKLITTKAAIEKIAKGQSKISDFADSENYDLFHLLMGAEGETAELPFNVKQHLPYQGDGLVRLVDRSIEDELIFYDRIGLLELTEKGKKLEPVQYVGDNVHYLTDPNKETRVSNFASSIFLRYFSNELEQKLYVGQVHC